MEENAQAFFEAFPQLQLNDELTGLLESAVVTRIVTNYYQTELTVLLSSDHLIPKEKILEAEKAIMEQIFKKRNINVTIKETFSVSDQYTLPSLMEVYWPSVLTDVRMISVMEYNLLRRSSVEYPDDHSMIVTMEDSMVAHQREEEIRSSLDRICNVRCGMNAAISVRYRSNSDSRANKRRRADDLLKREANDILQNKSAGESDVKKDRDGQAPVPIKQSTPKEKHPARARSTRLPRRSDGPDVIWGHDFDGDAIGIDQIDGEMGEVVICGKVISLDEREIRGEKTIVRFVLTDLTDSIAVKIFCKNEDLPALKQDLYIGAFLKVSGMTVIDNYDRELNVSSVSGIKKIPSFLAERMDNCQQKRVELHCHTKMSDMDAVTDVKDLIMRAKEWGHRAIAITDHGDVQAFTEAAKIVGKDDDFKILYGMEAYLVDDLVSPVKNTNGQNFNEKFVVFDLETTGFSPDKNQIIEIGAVKIENGEITDRFSSFVNPGVPISFHIEELTGINNDMVHSAPAIAEVLPRFMEFCEDAVLVAHNADFDMSFIHKNCEALAIPCEKTVIDTVLLARILMPQLNRYRLDTLAKALHIPLDNHHRAVDDAETTAQIFLTFVEMLAEREIATLDQLADLDEFTEEGIKKLPYYHCILLALNDTGRVNLYRLVSASHIRYFNRRPRIPKSAVIRYREGLLVGSACEAGELYRAVLNGRSQDEIVRIADFYDYFEIQPVGNNAFMIRDENIPVESEDEIRALNRRIVQLGEEMNKPVVATGDVHFLDPQDEVYRRIIMYGKHFKDADIQPPLYLRTTEEMLEEFSYLGEDKAKEIVITNTNRIADLCEKISAIRPDKCPPEIDNSDQMLRDICYRRAHEIYGDTLPATVADRLERELTSIISNGFAVLYIIAQKLVWKSNEDGYLVGSRGSVGSSLAARMAGITEVNPLTPHYICPKCHYTDFDSEEVRAFAGRAGCDMPDRSCPVCGEKLLKDGFDIPFETFLGFEGDKEPDIDLNFSGDYQSKAHKYTEVIFGDGQTYRAGTIGTLADKTAFGFVKNYFEEHEIHKRSCEIDRLVQGCVGVRRTTGQHPGGIIVLPIGEDICSFTPVQHPANDMTTDIVTTHFDYHSIEHNLLKLDILGHDDPTMIRMLQDLTGIDPHTIPLDCPEVMTLFQNTSALGIEPEDISGCKLGALGVPEFGTDYAMQILLDTHPTQFSDLVRIAGLSHGTDVWGGNAQVLLREGRATISTAICTRDDIMTYLISKGIESQEAFNIMEKIRKGDVAKGKCSEWPRWKQDMLDHDVPEWYPESCEKIQYMFPKAHAVAYVMMAWRIAYWKVFYPLEYYAAFFSIRATAFDYAIMCQGRGQLEGYLNDYLVRKDDLSKKEQDTLRDMRVVQEMYARGFEFTRIDIYKAQAHDFQIIDGKLMPAIDTIEGMGEKAAEGVEEAAKDGVFLSKDDFRERTKVSKPVADLMTDLGLLADLPETNQLSLFDF